MNRQGIKKNIEKRSETDSRNGQSQSQSNQTHQFQNTKFQQLIKNLIEKARFYANQTQPASNYYQLLEELRKREESDPDYDPDEATKKAIELAAGQLKKTAQTLSDDKNASNLRAFESLLADAQSNFPEEMRHFTELFQKIAESKADDARNALIENVCAQLGLSHADIDMFVKQDLLKLKKTETERERERESAPSLLLTQQEVLVLLPNHSSTSRHVETDVKPLEQLIYEMFNTTDQKESLNKEHYRNEYLGKPEALQLEANYHKVKAIYAEKWKNQTAEQLMKWCKEKKRALQSSDVFEAIAVLDRANELSTPQAHCLRDTQILAALCFLQNDQMAAAGKKGLVCQIHTGEGKTTIISVIAAVQALRGFQVDVITSNSVLAEESIRDRYLFFQLLRLSIGSNKYDEKYMFGTNKAYTCNIVYGSIESFQFDYLRHTFLDLGTRGNRHFDQVILDEVDSMLIDNAAHIAKLSEPFPGMESLRYVYVKIWEELIKAERALISQFDENLKQLKNLDLGEKELRQKIAEALKLPADMNEQFKEAIKKSRPIETFGQLIPEHLIEFAKRKLDDWIESAIQAKFKFKRDQQYILKEVKGELMVVPVDYQNTGIVMNNTIWSNGLHQFIQLKHNLRLTSESLTSSLISNLSYIRQYRHLAGLTGTLGSHAEQDLLGDIYSVAFSRMPTYKRKRFRPTNNLVVENEWLSNTLALIAVEKASRKRATLLICETIADVKSVLGVLERHSAVLRDAGKIALRVKTYMDDDAESARTVNEPVECGDVIVATNLAGRGTDLRTSHDLNLAGGLHVCVGFLPCNQRVEEQALGRTARQGKPGTGQLVVRRKEIESLGLNADQNGLTFDEIKASRDEYERHRVANVKAKTVGELIFQDGLFRRFVDLCAQIKSNKQFRKEYDQVLNDLKEFWAFWLDQNASKLEKMTPNEAEQKLAEKFEEFKAAAIDIGIIKFDKQSDPIVGEIKFNPYYSIQQAEYYLINCAGIDTTRMKKAKASLEHALTLTKNLELLYSLYVKLAEVWIELGGQLMKRFKKALGQVILLDIFVDFDTSSEYREKALFYLDKARKALEKETTFIERNFIHETEVVDEFKNILVAPDNHEQVNIDQTSDQKENQLGKKSENKSENLLLRHFYSRKCCLKLFMHHVDQLSKQINSDLVNMGFALNTRIPGFCHELVKQDERLKKAIFNPEINELSVIGLDTMYSLRAVHDVPDAVVRTAQAQLATSISLIGVCVFFPPAGPILGPLANTLAVESITDIAMELLMRGNAAFNRAAFVKAKLISYAVSAFTAGLTALAHCADIIQKAINACRSLSKALRSCKYLKGACEILAKGLDKIGDYLEKIQLAIKFAKATQAEKLEKLQALKLEGRFKDLSRLGGLKQLEHLKRLQAAGKLVEATRLQYLYSVCINIGKSVGINLGTTIGIQLISEHILTPCLTSLLSGFEDQFAEKAQKFVNDDNELKKTLAFVDMQQFRKVIKEVGSSQTTGQIAYDISQTVVANLTKQYGSWMVKAAVFTIEKTVSVRELARFNKTFCSEVKSRLVKGETRVNDEVAVNAMLDELGDVMGKMLNSRVLALANRVVIDVAKLGFDYFIEASKKSKRDKEVKKLENEFEERTEKFKNEVDSDRLGPADKRDAQNLSKAYRKHIVIKDTNGNILEEFGREYDNGANTSELEYSQGEDGIGHYRNLGSRAGEVPTTAPLSCLFDALSVDLNESSEALRIRADDLRPIPADLVTLCCRVGLNPRDRNDLRVAEFVRDIEAASQASLIGGQQQRFIMYPSVKLHDFPNNDTVGESASAHFRDRVTLFHETMKAFIELKKQYLDVKMNVTSATVQDFKGSYRGINNDEYVQTNSSSRVGGSISEVPLNRCSHIDACHINAFGLEYDFDLDKEQKIQEFGEMYLSRTNPLPRFINIGIDRDIDKLQIEFASIANQHGSFNFDSYLDRMIQIFEKFETKALHQVDRDIANIGRITLEKLYKY